MPDDSETPLITAASYGDADVARALIEAGADIEAVAADDAGGVPGGTALLHAGVFGMTDVVDVLVPSGARVHGIVEAAAAGDITGFLTDETPLDAARARADDGRGARPRRRHRGAPRRRDAGERRRRVGVDGVTGCDRERPASIAALAAGATTGSGLAPRSGA